MDQELYCFRCGESLRTLTPPISRQDTCPSCACFLHACRMCINFDPSVPTQCSEDDAEDVVDKEKANFCDWFKPSPNAFDATGKQAHDKASSSAEALFGGDAVVETDDDSTSAAEDLFK